MVVGQVRVVEYCIFLQIICNFQRRILSLGGTNLAGGCPSPPPKVTLGGGSDFFENLQEYLLYDHDSMCARKP